MDPLAIRIAILRALANGPISAKQGLTQFSEMSGLGDWANEVYDVNTRRMQDDELLIRHNDGTPNEIVLTMEITPKGREYLRNHGAPSTQSS